MRQDEVIDNILLEDYSEAVSGINDSSYNSFPASNYYMGGFAPTVEPTQMVQQPIISDDTFLASPSYMGGFAPTVEPIEMERPIPIEAPAGKCMRVIFTAKTGVSAYAYWTDCSGAQKSQFVSVNETLEVDALDGTAYGLPFMSYPIGQTPPINQPVEPVTPVYTQIPVTEARGAATLGDLARQYDLSQPNPNYTEVLRPDYTTEGVTMASNINQKVLRPDYTTEGVTMASNVNQVKESGAAAPSKPASETLPTKVSKDLKPYIIAGIVVVGILIASRLLSKK